MSKKPAIFGLILSGALALAFGCNAPKGGDAGGANTGDKTSGSQAAADKTPGKGAPAGDSDIVPVGTSFTKGPATAPITIVEFSEFQCPFCARVLPTLDQIKKEYGDKVRIVFKHNPLPFHKDAPYAAQAAIAAGQQGKFWEMHDKLFQSTKDLQPEKIEAYAKEIGLDIDRFKKDVESEATKKQVQDDMALANKVGARGTPNFLINGVQVVGAQPFDRFKAIIDEQLKAAEEAAKAGTKPEEIYATLVKKNFKAPAPAPDSRGDSGASDVVYKVPTDDSPRKGGSEPLVTIVEFSEFQCPFCARVLPTMDQVLKEYGDKVAIVFKHNPLPFHKDAPYAAKAAIAAGKQGKFWEMHDKLFQSTKDLQPEKVEVYATELGLDLAKFKADVDAPETQAIIDRDMGQANQFGARGTPNFFVNGRQVTGARPFEAFKSVIDQEIKKAEAAIAAGTPRANVYAKLTENGKTKAEAPQPRAPQVDTTVYKVPVNPEDAVKGPADALVTIVEFSEFQCPFCARVLPTLDGLVKKYGNDLRIVYKHNPLPFHKEAPYAAQAALAAGEQGKFWEMHDKLFANMKALAPEAIDGYAKEIGLDMGKFKAAVESDKIKKQVEADMALARQIGAGGTPNFFINGRKLVGAQPQENFEKLIDEELTKAKALVAKGVARNKVYEETTKNGASAPAAAAAQRAPEQDNKVYDLKINPGDAIKGPADAPITIVEFSEFQCPFCARVLPTLDQVQKEYGDKVRIVFKHNPLSFHKDAPLASEAALAAGEQGKFWPMHDILFKNQRALSRENIEGYAQEIGLNMVKFKSDLDSGKFKSQIEADQALAREVGASGTPTFFINGRKLRGAQPFDQFKALIDEELKKKGK